MQGLGTVAEKPLTDQQQRFVDEYLVDLNASAAAARAGYSARTAYSQGQRLLKHVEVAAAISAAIAERSERTKITQDMVLSELAKLGFSDIRKAINWRSNVLATRIDEDTGDREDFFTSNVELVDSAEIDDGTAAAIAEISQTDKGGLRVKFYDKRAALTDIGRHLGMFKDKIEHSGINGTPIQHEVAQRPQLNRDEWLKLHGIAAVPA